MSDDINLVAVCERHSSDFAATESVVCLVPLGSGLSCEFCTSKATYFATAAAVCPACVPEESFEQAYARALGAEEFLIDGSEVATVDTDSAVLCRRKADGSWEMVSAPQSLAESLNEDQRVTLKLALEHWEAEAEKTVMETDCAVESATMSNEAFLARQLLEHFGLDEDDDCEEPETITECCGCGLKYGNAYPCEPSVTARLDGKVRCNDCQRDWLLSSEERMKEHDLRFKAELEEVRKENAAAKKTDKFSMSEVFTEVYDRQLPSEKIKQKYVMLESRDDVLAMLELKEDHFKRIWKLLGDAAVPYKRELTIETLPPQHQDIPLNVDERVAVALDVLNVLLNRQQVDRQTLFACALNNIYGANLHATVPHGGPGVFHPEEQ